MEINDFPWKVKVFFFPLMDFTVAVGLTAAQYYVFLWVFWMLLQKCWQLDRWANLGMDFPGNPLDSVRPKASSPQKLPICTAGSKPNYSFQIYCPSQDFTEVGYTDLHLEKTLETGGGWRGPIPWHSAEYSPFCALHHSTLVVWLWSICVTHCTFKAHCDGVWGTRVWKPVSLFPFLSRGCKVNTLKCDSYGVTQQRGTNLFMEWVFQAKNSDA